jgi:hypothetical protein
MFLSGVQVWTLPRRSKLLGRSRKRFNLLSTWNSIIVRVSQQDDPKGEGGIEKFSRNCYRERDSKLLK